MTYIAEENIIRKSTLTCLEYEKLFNNANDAIFFVEADENAVPKCFIDVNERGCDLLGYSKEEVLKIVPLNICVEIYKNKYSSKETLINCKNLLNKKKDSIEATLIAKDGHYIPIEVSLHVFELNGKIVYLATARDITKRKKIEQKSSRYLKFSERVFKGITDVIGVYKPDNTIMLYNQAGYDFFKKSPYEVNNKKCYEMFNRKQKCPDCLCEKAIETKQIMNMEKYIPEIDKYIEFSYNPVMDDSGEVIFVVEQLRDITERKKIENALKESEESYRQIVNLSPDAIIIIVDHRIVLANKKALKHCDKLIGESVFKFAPDFKKTINKRINQLLENKKIKATFDYKIIGVGKGVTDVEVSSNYLIYQGKQAVISTIRDITKKKNELNAAAKIQRQGLQKSFPCSDKVMIETVYAPAKTVSGDFFRILKADEDLIIGILADVSGKGITAALNISAFNVLFHEAVSISHEPFEIINNLNKKVTDYVGERYIAACCFSLDFKNNKAKIVGAGINEFVFQNSQYKYEERIVKGPFLGMFEDSLFDEQIIDFKSGDRFYFFTDGLDFIFDNNKIRENYMKTFTIYELKNYLNNLLNDMLTDIEGIKDDCTLLAMKIK